MRLVRGLPLGVLLATSALIVGSAWVNRDDTAEITAGISQLLGQTPLTSVRTDAWTDVREFYRRRENFPAWIVDEGTGSFESALQVIRRAREHGLDPADYGENQIAQLHAAWTGEDGDGRARFDSDTERVRALAELDVRVTTALLALGRDVAVGRRSPTRIDRRWKARRQPPDFVGTLTAAREADLTAWLDAIRPRHPQYAALQRALAALHAEQAGVQRKQDTTAVRLKPDTTVRPDTTALAINLERWRWMPDDLGARHVIVNIPTFHLVAREGARSVLDMRVVVGTVEHKTPVFSGAMSTVVFSPYWNVPDSIAEGETAPAAARDSQFLERNEIEILRRTRTGITIVDPSTVDWNDPEALRELAFRQRPGAKNALGHVKFLFPNPYDVYLHDTPADGLFARRGRAFSHGCVRVEQPEALAQWVLKEAPEWDHARIVEAMHAGEEKPVKLKQTIPVHIVYFTAWADDAGEVRFDPDVYGYDAVQLRLKAEL